MSLLAIQSPAQLLSAPVQAGFLWALVSALLMNVCIVGINQVYDVEIDRVNKPELPLPSGDMSLPTAISVVVTSGLAALALGATTGSAPLMATLVLSLALGVAYSTDLPFLRWKRHPLLAAMCILVVRLRVCSAGSWCPVVVPACPCPACPCPACTTLFFRQLPCYLSLEQVRALLVQAGFYLHMRVAVLGGDPSFSGPVLGMTAFMCLFSIVIALFKVRFPPIGSPPRVAKGGRFCAGVPPRRPRNRRTPPFSAQDMPDVEGDVKANISTASVRLGVPAIFRVGIGLLTAAYVLAALMGATASYAPVWRRLMAAGLHAGFLGLLWWRAQQVDLRRRPSIASFYMFIWKLFYAEYLFAPFGGWV